MGISVTLSNTLAKRRATEVIAVIDTKSGISGKLSAKNSALKHNSVGFPRR